MKKFLPTNEFVVTPVPNKADHITLAMSRTSKRNSWIRAILPIAINVLFLAGMYVASEAMEETPLLEENPENPETPEV